MKKREPKEECIKDVTCTDGGIVYRYMMFERKSLKVASYRIPLYTIKVIMQTPEKTTESSVADAFSDIGKATVFFNKLVENLATPIDLEYTYEDKIWI
ncbi:MAG: hypothetical protein E7617_07415 [Ruminococcaceae bacterium]|nr:hypothetical protein [Oscillospiraceae bacterium]